MYQPPPLEKNFISNQNNEEDVLSSSKSHQSSLPASCSNKTACPRTTMIPAGDHNSRSLLLRRVSSWSQLTLGDSVSVSSGDDALLRPLLPELEYEQAPPSSDSSLVSEATMRRCSKVNFKLWVVFALLVVSGVANVIFLKMQALPMYNYPTFLTIYANFMYIPISFLYILPVSYFGWFQNSIPRAHITSISKKPFMVMGALDSLSAAMQILASVYLPGKLLVLLPQAAIPFSMIASRWILREHFTRWQYMGAAVVFGGIGVVLFPVLTQRAAPEYSCQALDSAQDCTVCQMETTAEDCLAHQKEVLFADDSPQLYCQWVSKDESLRHDDFLVFVWSLVMVASCIPMVLSSVYKQVALQVHLDPILVNGWVAIFQLLCSLPLAILAGLVSSPSVRPVNLPENWWQASQCLFDNQNFIELGCHPDDCVQAALWVHLGLLSSVVYTMSVIFVLKYGSSSMLYLGLTAVVPLGHLVFAVHSPSYVRVEDIVGLVVLLLGLMLYRFGHDTGEEDGDGDDEGSKGSYWEFLREPFMLSGDV